MKNNQFTLADIRNAVSAGVLSEEAFARLEGYLTAQSPQSPQSPETEKFTLFRGMNDIFIALGIAALTIGWFVLWGLLANGPAFWIAPPLAMIGYVALAEYIAGKLQGIPALDRHYGRAWRDIDDLCDRDLYDADRTGW